MVTSSHNVIPVMFNAVFTEHRFVCFTQSAVTLYLVVNTKTNRPKSHSKVRRELSGSQRIIARKFVATNRTQRIIVRIFAGLKTIGVTIMWGNIVELSLGAKFLQKAPKPTNFVEICLHYFCTALYIHV